jgi:hypothetical protein
VEPDEETIADWGKDDNVMVCPCEPCKSPAPPEEVFVITVLAGSDTETNEGFAVVAVLAFTCCCACCMIC